jgi:hypothetical protein
VAAAVKILLMPTIDKDSVKPMLAVENKISGTAWLCPDFIRPP